MDFPACRTSPGKLKIIYSQRMRPSVLIVPVDDSNSRQFGLRKASADGSLLYFSCRRCEYLNKIGAADGAFYMVSVHVVNGCVKYPYGEEHHPSCAPVANGQLKALEINRKYKRMVRAGQEKPFDAYEKVCARETGE